MELNTIYHGDCLDIMNDIPDGSIDMILCDLPYGKTQNPDDIQLPFESLWAHYTRVTKHHAVIALFAQGLFYVDLVNSNRKMFRYDLIWDKELVSGFLNANRMPLRIHEQVAIFYKSLGTYNPQMTEGNPLHSMGESYKSRKRTNRNYGTFTDPDNSRSGCTSKYPTSIIRFRKPHPSAALHPTEKSLECVEYLVKTYSNEGDIILDNCIGSGTTAEACTLNNRNFIGIEKDAKYVKIANDRLNNHS